MKLTGNGPIFIALEKGYFAAEGLAAEFVPFDNPIASAVVAGDIDFRCRAAVSQWRATEPFLNCC